MNDAAQENTTDSESTDWLAKVRGALGSRRSKSGKTGVESSHAGKVTATEEKISKDVEALFSPKNFKAIVTAPANIRLAVTGREYWRLSKDEEESLAHTGAMTAQYFMKTDPKWITLSMFLFNVGMVYGTRIMQDVQHAREEKAHHKTE